MIARVAARSLLAIVFAFVTIRPAFNQPCPVHEPALAAIAGASHILHDGTHGHGLSHANHPAQPQHNHQHHDGSHQCHCVDCSACTQSVALASPTLAYAPAIIATQSAVPLLAAAVQSTARAEHSLPFSTAPPQLLDR